MGKQLTPEEIKGKIEIAIEKSGFTTFGDSDKFLYDPNKPVKCEFNLILDHFLWSKFSELAEELSTSPTLLVYMLMEQTLLSTGKLQGNWKEEKEEGGEKISDPIVVQVKDLQQDKEGKFLSLGQNKVLGIAEDRKLTRRQIIAEKEEVGDEEENLMETNFLAELND